MKKRKVKGPNYCVSKWTEFCRSTDLHGYKYIVMPGLSFLERCCWAAVVMLCMGSAGYLVVTAWHWYSRNPTVTVIESTHGAIWDVPFPAVTICDLNMVSKRAARRFADSLKITLPNVTADDVFAYLRVIPLFSSIYMINEETKYKMSVLQTLLDHNNISIDGLFQQLNPHPCNRLVQRCMWKNTIYRCEVLFSPIVTHLTSCCSFNYYAVDPPPDWFDSSANDMFRPKTPRRVASCGYQSALTVLISIDPEDYYSTAFASYGALVYVDSAYNFPDGNSPVRLVNPQMEMFVAVSPERTYATKGIGSFGVNIRECIFGNEMNLGAFKTYSYHNCLIYKKSQYILRICKCIPHYMPKNDSVRFCNFNDVTCLQNVKEQIRNDGLKSDGSTDLVACMPDCEHFAYPLEVATGHLARHSPLNGLAFFKDITLRNHSVVNVYFNDLVSTRFRRDVYLNWQNLLASFGGLLGLLLGFTLISGVDFIIFIFFRVLLNTYPKSARTSRTISEDLDRMDTTYKSKNNQVGIRLKSYGVKKAWADGNQRGRSNTRRLEGSRDPPAYEDAYKF